MRADGKVIVVTGAGNGIGQQLVMQLIAKGALVAGIDMSTEALRKTEELCGSGQTRFSAYLADISDRDAVEAIPAQVLQRYGAIDGVINNAGIIQPFVRLVELDYATIDRIFRVNFYGTLHVTKAFLPHLLKRPEAHIVNIASMGGFVPVPGQTIYGASKAAVKLLTEGLAGELMHTGVKVTVAFPGAVATNILSNSGVSRQPSSGGGKSRVKPLQPAQAARLIISGMEKDAYQVMVGGDSRLIDRLYRLNPAFASRTIAKKMRALISS